MQRHPIDRIALFFFELGQQQEVNRHGWRLIGAQREPLGVHVARAAQIGFVLALMEEYESPERVATALIFHDLPECRTGDADKIMARYMTVDERHALKEQTEPLGIVGAHIARYWTIVEERDGALGVIAKDADYLECAVRARELEVIGHTFATDWWRNVKGALRTKSAKELYDQLMSIHPHTWWAGLKKLK
jgi:putative hydrolase of HD superfamily